MISHWVNAWEEKPSKLVSPDTGLDVIWAEMSRDGEHEWRSVSNAVNNYFSDIFPVFICRYAGTLIDQLEEGDCSLLAINS